jgi:hypothetical protein
MKPGKNGKANLTPLILSSEKARKEIKDPKSLLKNLMSPNNCRFGSKFWIRLDETDAFFVNIQHRCNPGSRMEY